MTSMSDSIKRLAISQDGHPQAALSVKNPANITAPLHGGILTVMSSAQDDFSSKYSLVREIGKGGFSTVYQCKEKGTGIDYAVKVTIK